MRLPQPSQVLLEKNVETAKEGFFSLVSDNSGDLADIKRSQCSDEELEGKIWTL